MASKRKTMEAFDIRVEDPDPVSASIERLRGYVREPSEQATQKVVVDQKWNESPYQLKVIPQPQEENISDEHEHTPSRRRSMFVMASGVGIGIVLAFAILAKMNEGGTNFAQPVTSAPVAEISTAAVSAPVEPITQAAAPEVQTAPAVEQVSLTEVIPAEPTAIEHAINSAVTPEARKFIYAGGSERSYSPVLIPPSDTKSITGHEAVAFKEIGTGSRFGSNANSVEWQGGWSLNNAEKNMQLGTAYDSYLKETFGSKFAPKLIGVEQQTGGLLQKVTRSGASAR